MTTPAQTVATESKAHGVANHPKVALLQKLMPIAARLFPNWTARTCLRLFLTPSRPKRPKWETQLLEGSTVSTVKVGTREITAYQWGSSGPKVVLCHGWSGRGSQMGAFAAPLVQAGFTVHAFDAPAHGTSGGTQTDMIEYAETLAGLVEAIGPVHALVAHSFGAANAVIARHRHRFPVNRMALLSCFASGEWVLDRFAEFLNIPAPALARMKAIHEQRHGMSFKWREMEISKMARQETASFLFVHDRNDKEVPYAQMAGFSAAPPANASFLSTDGLGHRRILRDPAVIRDVCNFIIAA